MASYVFVLFIFSILQCSLVISSTSPLEDSKHAVENSPIPVSELVEGLRSWSQNAVELHYTIMFEAAGHGDRLYDLSKNLSVECSRIARATILTSVRLTICADATEEVGRAIHAAGQDVRHVRHQLEEHPLEPLCRTVEKQFANNSKLSAAFENAKKEAAKFNFASGRPTYSRELLQSPRLLLQKFMEILSVPEMARMIALGSFVSELQGSGDKTSRSTYFAKSCVAVAELKQCTDSIQSIFDKTLNETVPKVSAGFSSAMSSPDGVKPLVSQMMRTFYGYIANDPTLKKELERMAAIIGKDAKKEDLDFSKL